MCVCVCVCVYVSTPMAGLRPFKDVRVLAPTMIWPTNSKNRLKRNRKKEKAKALTFQNIWQSLVDELSEGARAHNQSVSHVESLLRHVQDLQQVSQEAQQHLIGIECVLLQQHLKGTLPLSIYLYTHTHTDCVSLSLSLTHSLSLTNTQTHTFTHTHTHTHSLTPTTHTRTHS